MVLTGCGATVTLVDMFERFTKRARHVVVLAQEEARGLQHNYIGTEHLLLGLLGEPEGLAGTALTAAGVTLAPTRDAVRARVGLGKKPISGHIPFTPRAKKVLELGLREALALHHNYIGTEHLLLGVIREGDGVGAQVLRDQVGDLLALRLALLDTLPAPEPRIEGRRWPRRGRRVEGDAPGDAVTEDEVSTTRAADVSLDEAARLAGAGPVGSHHLLLATLADPNTAAAQALARLGVDLDQAREALRQAEVTGTSDEQPEEAGRRTMLLRVTDDRLTIEVTDPLLVSAAQAALQTIGDPGAEVIRGDLPISASLTKVWDATHDSLQDIRRRAEIAKAHPSDPDVPTEPAS
jgi:ATP-dependent Clp protease ATP-binding subunit ClpA